MVTSSFTEGIEIQINTETTDDQKKATVIALEGGGYVGVWESTDGRRL